MRKIIIFTLIIFNFFILLFFLPKAQAENYTNTKFDSNSYLAIEMLDGNGKNIDVPSCLRASPDKKTCVAVDTALGEISTNPPDFVKFVFSIVLGFAGGIALIMIIISGYKFMASQGNPEAVKGASEQLTSAIIGLLFIIFAFVILQIIGVDILQIPGFSR